MSKAGGFVQIDARSHESLKRFHTRAGGWEPTSTDMPFDRILDASLSPANVDFLAVVKAGDDGHGGEITEYEMRQRMIGAKQIIVFLMRLGPMPMDVIRQFTAVARGMNIAPYSAMTMEEVAMMDGQGKASHSWRCKYLSKLIEQKGMKGSTLPGQKSKSASKSYEKARKGNCNRKGGKKVKAHAERQESFLRALQVQPRPVFRGARQGSFLKQLHVPTQTPNNQ